MTTSTITVGDRVRVIKGGPGFTGLVGTVVRKSDRYSRSVYVEFDNPPSEKVRVTSDPNGGPWGVLSLEKIEAAPEPVAIRASLQHETSRDYAGRANSTKLAPEHQQILSDANLGKEVDVVAFRKAVTAALSLASTRAGQSPARRVYAKEARHLIYWADALIDNALAGLPPIEPGQRSPKIKALEQQVEEVKARAARYRTQVEGLRENLAATDGKLVEAEKRVAVAERLLTDQNSVMSEVVAKRQEAEAERDILAQVLAYALESVVNPTTKARIFGYWDAKNGD